MFIRSNSKRAAMRHSTLILSFILAACGGNASNTSSPPGLRLLMAAPSVPVTTPATYTVANISSNGYLDSWDNRILNEKGQVSFSEIFGAVYHAARYDADTGTKLDLGALGSPNYYSFGTAINASGQVTGYAYNGSAAHAFRSDGTTMTDLGALGSPSNHSYGMAINASGQVTGYSSNGTTQHAFLSDGTTITDLGALGSPNNESRGLVINASGQVAGQAFNGSDWHAFRSDGMTMTDLGTLGSSNDPFSSYAFAINASGQVTGYSYNGMNYRAFRSDGTTMTDLGALGVPGNSYGFAINANGQVTGYTNIGSNYHAFLSDGTTMTDLGVIDGQMDNSVGYAINTAGQVVGSSLVNNTGQTHAFIKSPGDSQMIDLNTRLVNAPGVELYYAMAISDSGYIVAYANTGLVLLKPSVPLPAPAAATLGPITANDSVAIGTPVNVSVQFSDINTTDTHTAVWTWEGSGTTSGNVTEQNGTTPGTVTGSKTFTAAGVYLVTVNVTDSGGKSSQVSRQVVVYDPSAGFVTGGGWIMSPAGAYKADEMIAGRATFGFVSKYLPGAKKPSGETEFQFQAAKLNFHSSDYDWLVVGGARAQYKGTGTINGMGTYKFLLTAVDGDRIAKGTADRFRIKIWHHDDSTNTDVTDYDNQLSSSTEDTNQEGTAIGGGSITVHTK